MAPSAYNSGGMVWGGLVGPLWCWEAPVSRAARVWSLLFLLAGTKRSCEACIKIFQLATGWNFVHFIPDSFAPLGIMEVHLMLFLRALNLSVQFIAVMFEGFRGRFKLSRGTSASRTAVHLVYIELSRHDEQELRRKVFSLKLLSDIYLPKLTSTIWKADYSVLGILPHGKFPPERSTPVYFSKECSPPDVVPVCSSLRSR